MFHVKHSRKIHARDLADRGLAVRRDQGEKTLAEWLRYDGVTPEALSPWLGDLTALDPLLAEEMAEDAAYARTSPVRMPSFAICAPAKPCRCRRTFPMARCRGFQTKWSSGSARLRL